MSYGELVEMAIIAAQSDFPLDLPIGSIIVDATDRIVATAKNTSETTGDFRSHAEMNALDQLMPGLTREVAKEMTMVVTLEPCPMCAWSIRLSGIGKVVFGAHNPQYGAAGSVFDLLRDPRYGEPVEVLGGVLEDRCKALLDDTFRKLRNNKAR